VLADRAQFFKDLTTPFYGYNREGAKPSQGVRDTFWAQGMQCGIKNAYDCIKQFSETDFTEDLKKIDVPTLIVHGDDDQIVRSTPPPRRRQAGQERHAADLRRRAARPADHPQGQAERRPAGFPQVLILSPWRLTLFG
jgi:pimeloyl-ACP methyl ester carboxylesterase